MRDLIEQIIGRELTPGSMLPREVDLAEHYGVSRGVARECIRGLEERGVVSVVHGKGATVTEPDHWNLLDPEILAAVLHAPGGDELIAEALECQRMLEVEAAALAAQRARHEDLEALSQALQEMESSAEKASRSAIAAARYREARLAFHRAVVRASGNRALAQMAQPLYRALASAGARADGGFDLDTEREIAEYTRILTAIADGNEAEAMEAIDEHLRALAVRLQSA